jgi:serine protease Do
MSGKSVHRAASLIGFALVLVSCGGGGTEPTTSGTETTIPPVTSRSTIAEKTPTVVVGSGAVSTLADVKGAVVRIVAEGSFVDPDVGTQYNATGVGSGFIIDEAGLAVTNNHVVTGAAFLQVYVGGETEPRNARVLGVSECSDLAIIDIDGDGYPYLEWFEGDLTAGMELYAVGFPLGTEEYTVLDGVISKERADGESTWASVDHVIEHSADTLPGNSGGPAVTKNGQVLAVTYAGDNAGQSYAIGRDEALKVVDQLMAGQDVTSLGINGQAIVADGYSGIWVASVKSGSPAQEAGIRGGDVVTLFESLVLSTDGTMADYCDILRSHLPTDHLSIEIFRPSTGEFLEGTLNSGEELVVSFSFETELEDVVVDTGVFYTDYMEISDATGSLFVDVPVDWFDTDGGAWVLGGDEIGVSVSAAPSLTGYNATWTTPGIFFGASRQLVTQVSTDELLDMFSWEGACDGPDRDDYDDGLYTGRWDVWENCGGTDTLFVNVAAMPDDQSFMMLVQVQVVNDADLEALDRALSTFIAFLDL